MSPYNDQVAPEFACHAERLRRGIALFQSNLHRVFQVGAVGPFAQVVEGLPAELRIDKRDWRIEMKDRDQGCHMQNHQTCALPQRQCASVTERGVR